MIANPFADARWEAPRLLAGMTVYSFYFHSMTLVKLGSLHQKRVTMTGHAAWAVMETGTRLALIGAYVDAGELACGNDVGSALARDSPGEATIIEPGAGRAWMGGRRRDGRRSDPASTCSAAC